jgi:hypothetical protein
MEYLLLLLEIAVTAFFLIRRKRIFDAVKLRINPNNHDEQSHNMVKTGKTKRIQAARSKYHNTMVLIAAAGLALITFTLMYNAGKIANQHRKDGLVTEVYTPSNDVFFS